MMRVRDLIVRAGDQKLLELSSLDIARGERLGIQGENGSGKSTLLRVLAGLQRPTSGTVDGCPPPGRTVLVHQSPYLFHGTARGNVAYALRCAKRPVSEAGEWLARLGAASFADRTARELSVGEQRRVALARALATRPEVLLLDEPTAGLDEPGIADLREALASFDGTLVVAAPELTGLDPTRTVVLPGS